jgi:hypothetical protein
LCINDDARSYGRGGLAEFTCRLFGCHGIEDGFRGGERIQVDISVLSALSCNLGGVAEEPQTPPIPMPVNEPGEYLDAPDLAYEDEETPEEVKAELARRAKARKQTNAGD